MGEGQKRARVAARATRKEPLTTPQREALKALAALLPGEARPKMHHLTLWGLKTRGFVSKNTGGITNAGRAALALLAEIS
jgi:hypothetical protein